jgi:hypothetical protein
MSSGLCQYSNITQFYCNRYYDENEVTFVNPYNPKQNFTYYVISDTDDNKSNLRHQEHTRTSPFEYESLVFDSIVFLNILLLFVVLVLCVFSHLKIYNTSYTPGYSLCYRRRRKGDKVL